MFLVEPPTADGASWRNGKASRLAPVPHGGGAPSADLMEAAAAWPERFAAKVEFGDGCWLWLASTTRDGYGRFGRGGRRAGVAPAHRYAYELTYGEIERGLVVDHLCRTPGCVRPDHLEAVTQAENVRRGRSSNSATGLCRRGRHRWDPTATIVEVDGSRRCAACRREWERTGLVASG